MLFSSASEDRALSPVIGVILLVGITVILVAVVGGLVTDFGSDVAVAPNVQMNAQLENGTDNVTLTHESGDDLNPEEMQYEIGGNGQVDLREHSNAPEGLIQAGDEVEINATDYDSELESGEEFRLIWVGENGGENEILVEEIVP